MFSHPDLLTVKRGKSPHAHPSRRGLRTANDFGEVGERDRDRGRRKGGAIGVNKGKEGEGKGKGERERERGDPTALTKKGIAMKRTNGAARA